MLLDLVDLLRCPNDHADAPLVCVARPARDRELETATLGCPVCHAEFTVQDGVAWLGPPPDAAATHAMSSDHPATAADVVRLAAMLDLTTPGGTVALTGGWAALARALAEMTACAVVVLANEARWIVPGHVSVLAGSRGIPLARASLRGIALGTEPAATLDARLGSAVAALALHGRLVAPRSCGPPGGCDEIARDDWWWVAERRERPQAVSLRRAPRRTPSQ